MKTLPSWERRVVAERSREAASNVDKAVDLYTCFRLDGFPTPVPGYLYVYLYVMHLCGIPTQPST